MIWDVRFQTMVIWKNGHVDAVDLTEVVRTGTTLLNPNSDYVKAAKDLGMYIGEI